jgi:hypothetical protein
MGDAEAAVSLLWALCHLYRDRCAVEAAGAIARAAAASGTAASPRVAERQLLMQFHGKSLCLVVVLTMMTSRRAYIAFLFEGVAFAGPYYSYFGGFHAFILTSRVSK